MAKFNFQRYKRRAKIRREEREEYLKRHYRRMDRKAKPTRGRLTPQGIRHDLI